MIDKALLGEDIARKPVPKFADIYKTSAERRKYLAERLIHVDDAVSDVKVDELFTALVEQESLEARAARRERREGKSRDVQV